MPRVVLALLTVGVTVYALVDCLRCTDDEVRTFPRQVWCLIVLVPLIGGIAWLVYGRPPTDQIDAARPRMVAPDDDPDFLRTLDEGFRDRRQRKQQQEEGRRRDARDTTDEAQQRDGETGPNGGGDGGGASSGEA